MQYVENYTRHQPAHLVFLEMIRNQTINQPYILTTDRPTVFALLIKFGEEILGLSFLGITTFMENQMRHVLFAFQFAAKPPVNLILR